MIQKNLQPEAWLVPDWHPDFGNAQVELEHLRSFAVALLAVIPGARVQLETPEPGLMNLVVKLPGGTSAEVYSIPATSRLGERRLGLFFAPGTADESEVYAESVESAVGHFTDS